MKLPMQVQAENKPFSCLFLPAGCVVLLFVVSDRLVQSTQHSCWHSDLVGAWKNFITGKNLHWPQVAPHPMFLLIAWLLLQVYAKPLDLPSLSNSRLLVKRNVESCHDSARLCQIKYLITTQDSLQLITFRAVSVFTCYCLVVIFFFFLLQRSPLGQLQQMYNTQSVGPFLSVQLPNRSDLLDRRSFNTDDFQKVQNNGGGNGLRRYVIGDFNSLYYQTL